MPLFKNAMLLEHTKKDTVTAMKLRKWVGKINMTLFEFTILGHNFGIGISWDWTLLYHALIYGGTVPVVALIKSLVSYYWWGLTLFSTCLQTGLITSCFASLYLEILQMWQFEWGCGMFGLADLAVSWGAAYLVYRILRR